jgi:hypothetical protein
MSSILFSVATAFPWMLGRRKNLSFVSKMIERKSSLIVNRNSVFAFPEGIIPSELWCDNTDEFHDSVNRVTENQFCENQFCERESPTFCDG